ncbi:hypothetical protein C7S16_3265 [Burkholderia thailandensis]|uniref:Uncharacterized protein n=1 Tax=Burkholderia thailandensis TaxID=57975 RepID=A0AAW9CVD0_BURTH|nr:hypothetical protein [Burkholderia thailandensis]MDW9254890.1 hypothetical protein [Burkholderia thailandensis]
MKRACIRHEECFMKAAVFITALSFAMSKFRPSHRATGRRIRGERFAPA